MCRYESLYKEMKSKGTLPEYFTGLWKSDKETFIQFQIQNEEVLDDIWEEDEYGGYNEFNDTIY